MQSRLRLVVLLTVVFAIGGGLALFYLRPKAEPAGPAIAANANPDSPAADPPATVVADKPVAASAAAVDVEQEADAFDESGAQSSARTGRGRVFGRAVLPAEAAGSPVHVALHLVDTNSADISYDDTFVDSVDTGSDGAFEFIRLAFGEYVLLASAPGYTINGTAQLSAKSPVDEVRLTLVPGGTVSGRVVNAQLEPVSDAHIFIAGWDIQGQQTFAPRDRSLASQRRSNENGEFTMENLRLVMNNEPGYKFAVKADGYSTFISDYIRAGTTGVEFVLSEGGVVSGILITLANGEPVPNKTVALDSELAIENIAAKTDAEGFFFLTDVPPGAHSATLRDEDLVITPDTADFRVADGTPTEEVVLQAAPGGRVTGRVYNAETGNGIAGVEIYANGQASRRNKTVTTDASGRYAIAGLIAGAYQVEYAKPEGYPENYRDAERRRLVTAAIGQETSGVDFALTQGLTISGRVVDEEGNPIGGAAVNAHSRTGMADYIRTNADGTFVVAGFSVGQEVEVSAGKQGYALLFSKPDKGKVTIETDGATGVEFTLGTAASVSGILMTKAGAPKAGVQVWMRSPTQIGGSPIENTGPDGSVAFENLAPGEYEFQFDGLPNDRKDAQRVKVAKGERIENVRIIFPELGGLKITGRVVDTRGKGIAGADISLDGPGWRQASADANGDFVVDGLAEARYSISASSYAHSGGERIQAEAGSTGVELVLKDLAKIEGQVVDAASGAPVSVFRVRTTGQSGQARYVRDNFEAVSDPQGRFTLTQVEDGANSIEVRADGLADAKLALAPLAGGETRRNVLVRMNAGVEVAGRVVDSSGEGIGAARIFIGQVPQEYQRERETRTTSAADGSFRLTSLSPGSAELSASHAKFAPKMVKTTLTAGARNQVEIVLTSGGSIEGVVTIDRQPAVNQHVSVSSRTGQDHRSTQTDGQGKYGFAGLPDGIVHLNPGVQLPGGGGFRGKTAQVNVKDGFVTEMNFDFRIGTSTIEGTVYEAPDQPLREQVHISAQLQDGEGGSEYLPAQTGANGSFIFENVPAGQVRLQLYVQSAGGQRSVSVAVGERQRIQKDIFLYGGATVVVQTNSVQYVAVLAGTEDIRELNAATANALERRSAGSAGVQDGVARITGLEPGTYTVIGIMYDRAIAESGGDPFATAHWRTQVVQVTQDQEVNVTLDL